MKLNLKIERVKYNGLSSTSFHKTRKHHPGTEPRNLAILPIA